MSIVIASNNCKKVSDIINILNYNNINAVTQNKFKVPSIKETGLTFVENAILKARNTCQYTGMATLSDDSGIIVDALNGNPGIYSARFCGPNATDNDNILKLLDLLSKIPYEKRDAKFHCVMVFLQSVRDTTPIICQGSWSGKITFRPVGHNGFGYDPIFFIPQYHCTAAQLSPCVKNKISHRAQALNNIIVKLKMLHDNTQ